MDPVILRVFRFRPAGPGFDGVLRRVLLPDLVRLPGIRGMFAGRVGPDEIGDRIVATLWATPAAMRAAIGSDFAPPVFHPELLDASTDRRLDVMRLVIAIGPDRPGDLGIIRLFTGTTRPGQLDTYVAEARSGTIEDREAGVGPRALYLATEPPDRFMTLSLWDTWETVEAATGSDHRTVDATRHAERLADWEVGHYEIVPGAAVIIDAEDEPGPAEASVAG